MRSRGATFETARRLASALPAVEVGTSYGTPALKVKGQLFARQHEEPDWLVVKMPFDLRDGLMADDPETYFITDHYRNYEWVLVRLSRVSEPALQELLRIAYRFAGKAGKAKTRRR